MKKGFTLAEVLITLAIIGVVAALTIPALVTQNQQRGWNTAAAVFERKLDEALKVMNTEGTLAGHSSTQAFLAELSKHLKIVKICNNPTECFEDKIETTTVIDIDKGKVPSGDGDITKITSAKNLGQKDWDSEAVGFQLNNGAIGIIAYDLKCKEDRYNNTFSATSCIAAVYDTNGFAKPNSLNKDVRTINSNYGSCLFKINGACAKKFLSPNAVTPMTLDECKRDKDKYGITSCYYEQDSWAGAVKACGGTDKMPTNEQLTKIASYIYNKNVSPERDIPFVATRNNQRASELGIVLNENGYYPIWIGAEYNGQTAAIGPYADYRGLDPNMTYWGYCGRASRRYTICMDDY